MAHINGRPDTPVGYFHESGDSEKTGTALRASFRPSLTNRITNKLARQERPKLANFVNNIRNIDLSMRQAVNQRRLDSARDRFNAVESREGATAEELQAAAAPLKRHQHRQFRLDTKKTLGETARAGELKDATESANEGLQERLLEEGYEPLSGLRATAHDTLPSRYLIGRDDGHRIKVNSERPPLLARMIANSVSAGYDRGSSGASRAIRSTVQHALVGVYSAEQSIKGMAARGLAGSNRLDQGARERMDVRAARTTQKRTMLQASLQGNVALNNAYRAVVDEQIASADERLDSLTGPRYEVRQGVGGIKPPQTRFWERRVNAYYQSPDDTATPTPASSRSNSASSSTSTSRSNSPAPSTVAGDDAPQENAQARRAGKIARFAIGVSNLRAKASRSVHSAVAKNALAKMERTDDPAKADRHAERAERHQAGANKWQHTVNTRRSVLQGELIKTLKDDDTRKLMNDSFRAPRDQNVHHPKPWEAADDDDDLYN